MTQANREEKLRVIKDYLAKHPRASLKELSNLLGISHQRVRVLLQGTGLETAQVHYSPQVLTDREHEILLGIAQGKTNKQIAKAVGLSHRTVKNHVHIIFNKLNTHDRKEAVSIARKRGLIHPDKY